MQYAVEQSFARNVQRTSNQAKKIPNGRLNSTAREELSGNKLPAILDQYHYLVKSVTFKDFRSLRPFR